MFSKIKEIITNPIVIVAIIGLIGTIYTVHFNKVSKVPQSIEFKSVKQSSYNKQSPNTIGNNNSINYEKSSR